MLLLLAMATYVGNDSCRPCHPAIAESYEKTAMAQSTKPASKVPSGSFLHQASQIEYRIKEDGRVVMRDRAGHVTEERFDYAIGSGAAGYSFLTFRDRWLWQAPITWYSQKARWAPSPGYELDRTMKWDRPVDPSCLTCHASQVTHIYGTLNRYAEQPFRQNGIGCERCHGPGSEHIKGRARMIRPTDLTAERRDDVCRQCHLMGEARIPREGRSFGEYRPGDRLGDFVAYFVYDDPAGARLRTTSHFEKIAESRCRQMSGGSFWCGSCHDVHGAPADPVTYFRQKCLKCHSLKTAQPCPRTANCIGCHMPKLPAIDAGHGAFTDHSLSRTPQAPSPKSPGVWRLRPFSPSDEGIREMGVAYLEAFSRTGDIRQKTMGLQILDGLSQKSKTAHPLQ